MDNNNQQQDFQQPVNGQQQQGQQQSVHPQQMPQQQPQQQPQTAQDDGGKLRVDDNLLHSVGLGQLPPAEKNKLLKQIYETLELRVGITLANQMTDAQLKEFEGFIDSKDERGALTWLESNFPGYKQVVSQELHKLRDEIQNNAHSIIEAINNPQPQPAQHQQAPQQPQQQLPQQPYAQPTQQQQYPQQPQDPNQPQ